ncbi:MAG: single-stranded DNA-binding protein [Rectinemataceae bacterium]|nr:single-stranded DNA-binding protein [Rectinemataceae bacterium]
MRDINVVVLVGRLTRDSELKYTKSGMPIARFSIAVNRSRKQGEEWVDETSFFEIDFWGKGAEAVNRYLIKGQQVGVEGELRQDRWEQDGQPRAKVVVNASNVRLLGSAPSGSGGGYQKPQQQTPAYEGSSEQQGGPSPVSSQVARPVDNFDDDIPF